MTLLILIGRVTIDCRSTCENAALKIAVHLAADDSARYHERSISIPARGHTDPLANRQG